MLVVIENKNIFISGNFVDTGADIELLYRLLSQNGFNVNLKLNDAGPSTAEMIDNSDVFVAVVSDQEGVIKNADGKTLPQAELDLAISLRRPVIGILKHPGRCGVSQNQESMRLLLRDHLATKLITYESTSDINRIVYDVLVQGLEAYAVRIGLVSPGEYVSVFLSYGGPDEPIARRFYNSFKRWGVNSFFFPETAEFGVRLHRTMDEGVNDHDRVVLLCSRESLGRPGVQNEIERVLSREAQEGGSQLLMPVALDGYVFEEWAPSRKDMARQIRDRVVADFRNALDDAEEFRKQFARLLEALKNRTA